MSQPFVQGASWIWSAEGTHAAPAPDAATPSHYQVRMFRRTFEVSEPGIQRLDVHVSADSRYVLFCNGTLVSRGPAKGDVNHHFYESVDVSPHLRAGTNVLAALVLDMSRVAHRPALLGAPCAVMTYAGGFVLEGALVDSRNESRTDLSTDARWKAAADTAHRFQNENTTFEGYHGYFEHRVSRLIPAAWTNPEFDDTAWPAASVLFKAERYENRRDPTSPYGLMARIIPPMEEGPERRFADGFRPGGGAFATEWKELIDSPKADVLVPPRSTVEVIFDVGELTTAFPKIEVEGGEGSVVRLTYAEALRLAWDTPGAKLLGRKQPLANLASHFADESTGWTFDRRGKISGWCDIWEPAGKGIDAFEPLHWRAFRYVGLRIATGEAALRVRSFTHRFSACPYEITAGFSCSDPRLEKIWRVSLHTMRLCSHETFEDCPYYEQMQYAGDTMITSKIAMLTTGDYRLSRQALLHFDWSRLSEGLTQSRYPSRLVQVIPSWSLHWISNVRDYAYCSGDLGTVRDLMPGMRAVLDWFRCHRDGDGLPGKLPFWNITDWCPWWPRGVVPGADTGPTCIISAQYITALDELSDLCGLVGEDVERADLRLEASALRRRLHERFWSEPEGLYFDRPGGPEISQYGNAWAVVCGAANAAVRARMLQRFPHDPQLAPGSFFWWHAGFRALAMAGAYDRMPEHLGVWHEMVENGLSTFVEENSYWRSLCHAWSAHPAIEFLTRVLGVTPIAPGFAEIEVAPHICGLTHASGSVCTPKGMISVAWRIVSDQFKLEIDAPKVTSVHVRLPHGERQLHGGGKTVISVALGEPRSRDLSSSVSAVSSPQ